MNAHRDTAASAAALLTFKNIKKYSWLWMCGHTFRGHSCCRVCRWSVTTEHHQVHLQWWDSCSSYPSKIATHRRVLMTRLMEKENIKVDCIYICIGCSISGMWNFTQLLQRKEERRSFWLVKLCPADLDCISKTNETWARMPEWNSNLQQASEDLLSVIMNLDKTETEFRD